MNSSPRLPDVAAVEAAARRIRAQLVPTPLLRWPRLEDALGAELFLKAEQRQPIGAFKLRGALNAVWSLTEVEARRGVVTHSSGNHGAALAWAARSRGIPAHIVMPEDSARAKCANVEAAGGEIHFCAPTQAAREALAAAVQRRTGAVFIHPYTDPRVIAGQGTVALEVLQELGAPDVCITPVGGGGLASGCAIVLGERAPGCGLFVAEPEGAADTIASLRAGHRVTDIVPDTVCDGLRATLGEINFQCLQAHGVQALPVSDAECVAAMRDFHADTGELIEPSSATVLAALRRHAQALRGRRIVAVLTGGNVDRAAWPWLA